MGSFSKGALERLKLHVFDKRTAIDVFGQMFKELSSDLSRAKSDSRSPGEQYHRRVYLRTLMSYSEAMIFWLKQYLLDQRDHLKINITPNEKLILNEQTVEMTDDGTIQTKPLMLSHKRNIRFTLKFVARTLDLNQKPDFGGEGWREYVWAIEKRNDLTHPKFPDDIQISDEELKKIDNAELWLGQEIAKCMNGWAEKSRSAQNKGDKN